jgi:MFS family permease
VARSLQLRWLVAAGTLAIAAAYLGVAAAPDLAVACVASALGGLGNGVQWIALVSWLQELTEERYQARVMALFESVAALMPGIGFIAGGAVADALSARVSFLAAGLGVVVVLAAAAAVLTRVSAPAAGAGARGASPPPASPPSPWPRSAPPDTPGQQPASRA